MLYRKILKISGIFILIVFGLVVVAILSINTSPARKFIADTVNRKLLKSGLPVQIGAIHSITLKHLHFSDILVHDSQDTIAYTGDVDIRWSAGALLSRKITVRSFTVQRLILRLFLEDEQQPLNLVKAFAGSGELEKDTVKNESKPWTFEVSNISLRAVNMQYHSIPDEILANLIIKEAGFNLEKTDLAAKSIVIPGINLVQADASLFSGKTTPKQQDTSEFVFPWNIKIDKISIVNCSYQSGLYPDSTGMQPSPLFIISQFQSEISGVVAKQDQVAITISKTGFRMNNGFELRNVESSVFSQPNNTRFKFHVLTNKSVFNFEGSSDTILFAIGEKETKSVFSVVKSKITLSDMLYFKPELQNASWFPKYGYSPVKLDIKITRTGDTIGFESLRLFQTNDLWLNLSGKVSNLEDSLLAKGFDLKLNSSMGNVLLKGKINPPEEKLKATISLSQVRTYPVLSQQVVEEVNGNLDVDIDGFKRNTLKSIFNLNLNDVTINHHSYEKIQFIGNVSRDTIMISGKITDPGLKLDLLTNAGRNGKDLNLQSAGEFIVTPVLLGLSKDTMTIKSLFSADFRKRTDNMDGSLDLKETAITAPGTGVHLSGLHFDMHTDSLESTVSGNSDFFDLKAVLGGPVSEAGTIAAKLGTYLGSLASNFFLDSAFNINRAPDARFDANIKYHPILGLFSNDTAFTFNDASIHVLSDSQSAHFNSIVNINKVKSGNVSIDHFHTVFSDSAGMVSLKTAIDSLAAESDFISEIDLSNRSDASLHHGQTHLIIRKDLREINTEIIIASALKDSTLEVSFPAGSLLLNGFMWQTDSTQILTFNTSSKEFLPKITLFTDSSALKLTATEENSSKGFIVDFNRVDLVSLIPSGMVAGNPSARIDGTIEYRNTGPESTGIGTNLNLANVSYSDIRLNKVTLKGTYNSTGKGQITANLNAGLDSARIHAEGNTSGENRVLSAEISGFSLNLLKPFVQQSLSEFSGTVSGKVKSTTENGRQSLEGAIELDSVRARVAAFNSLFRIPHDKISMAGGKVVFNRFRILDSLRNELLVNGNIDISDMKTPKADLNISTPKMLVMNSNKEDNQSFYGKIVLGTGISVKGPLTSPDIQGKLTLKNGTEIFYASQPSYKLQDMNETVTFINSSLPDSSDSPAEVPQKQNTVIETTVEIDPDTKIHFSMPDQMYNLKMDIQGGGLLNYSVSSTNQSGLSGMYRISEGNADVKIKGWSNKNFKISDGGFIRWIDRMDDPEMQIEAQSAVTGKYKNPEDKRDRIVEFNVVLKLANRLSDLDVQFTVATEDQYLMSVINSMSPEDQMKQAVSLLLFQTINIPGIYTSSNNVTDQVNQIVENQLNKITQTSIKNVDISLGVNSYTTPDASGSEQTQTSVSYNIKKNVLNDRATVEVSGSLNDYGQQGKSNNSLSNFTFEYRLDSAGTKYLHVYKQRSYEDLLEGEVDRTGIGLVFRKTYDSVRDIWRKRKK